MSAGSSPSEIMGLVKSFGGTRALGGLDLRVAGGEVHGFLFALAAALSVVGQIGLTRRDLH